MATFEFVYFVLQSLYLLNFLVSKGILALNCFECNDVFKPYSCNIVTKCTDGEKCYLDQYVTSSGNVLFKSGCRSTQRCAITRRSVDKFKQKSAIMQASDITSDMIICSTCCDTDFCNIEGCNEQKTPRQKRGPICFNCSNQGKHTCRHVTQCDLNFACGIMTHKQDGIVYYDSQCVHPTSHMSCNSTTLKLRLNVVGKRAMNTSRYCPKCCLDDFCNQDCTPPPRNGCLIKGTNYHEGQKWDDGCQYHCQCVNGTTGQYLCRPKCLSWKLPDVCHLAPPSPGKCCDTPICPANVVIRYPPGYIAE